MRGRNTENEEIERNVEVAEYQEKRHAVLKFIHEEKHVVFEPIEEGRRKKEIREGVQVVLAIVGQRFRIKN